MDYKLLGQGGYGCVYWPEIKCNGVKGSTKFITKIQKNNSSAANEFFIGEKIKKIKKYNNYFKPVISKCDISLKSIESDITETCDIINNNIENYIAMKIKYIKFTNFDEYFINSKTLILNIILTYSYLVNSLHLLYKEKIIHYDLKMDNILIHNNTPLIIDFGISIYYTNINESNYKDYFYVYAPEYYPWCFEIQVISYIVNYSDLQDLFTFDNIKLLSDNYIEKNPIFKYFTKGFANNYKNSLINYLKKYSNKSNNLVIKELLKTKETWDLYSLSILYLKLIYTLKNKFYKSICLEKLIEIFLINISPYPEKRMSFDKTINMINELKKKSNEFYKEK